MEKEHDTILQYIMEIKADTAGISEHLKQLNGKVIRNIQTIEDNRNEITNLRITIAKWLGAVGLLLIIFEFAIKFI